MSKVIHELTKCSNDTVYLITTIIGDYEKYLTQYDQTTIQYVSLLVFVYIILSDWYILSHYIYRTLLSGERFEPLYLYLVMFFIT